MKNKLHILITLMLVLTTSGCASVSLVRSAKDPTFAPKKFQKLLVVGISDKTEMRQIFEEVFASKVSKPDTTGIASYTVTGVKEKLSRASVEEAVKKTSADGVITTRLVGFKKNQEAHTGFIMTEHGFTDYYGMPVNYATFVHQPVEVTLSTEVAIETNLFDSSSGRLIWSGTSNAVNPEGIITGSRELADVVIKALAKDGLL